MLILVHHISTYLSMFQLFIYWNGMLKNVHHFNPFDWDLFYFYGGNFTVVFFSDMFVKSRYDHDLGMDPNL